MDAVMGADYSAHDGAEEPITFDYLLKKVVENTAGMSLKTTEDGTTFESGTVTAAEIESQQPAYQVRITDDDQTVSVSQVPRVKQEEEVKVHSHRLLSNNDYATDEE